MSSLPALLPVPVAAPVPVPPQPVHPETSLPPQRPLPLSPALQPASRILLPHRQPYQSQIPTLQLPQSSHTARPTQ